MTSITKPTKESRLKTFVRVKNKEIMTFAMYLCFFVYGIGSSIFAPVMLDMSEILEAGMDDLSWALAAKIAGYALLALPFGWLFSRVNRQMGTVVCLVIVGLTSVPMPLVKSLPMFFLEMVVQGMASSGIDVALNAWILEVWQEKANPYMQGMHFSWAVGATVAPLLCQPFLSKPLNQSLMSGNEELDRLVPHSESMIYISYLISCFLCLFAAGFLLVVNLVVPYQPRKREKNEEHEENREEGIGKDLSDSIKPTKQYTDLKWLIFLSNLLMVFYCSVENNIFSFFPDFAVYSKMRLSKSTAAFMTSVLSGSFALFRGISILTATKLSAERMLHMHFTLATLGSVLVVMAGHFDCLPLTWVSVVVSGAGCSCMFPSIYSYVEERIVVTDLLSGLYIFVSNLTCIIITGVVGMLIKSNPMIFAYFNVGSLLLCTTAFAGLYYIDCRHNKRVKQMLLRHDIDINNN